MRQNTLQTEDVVTLNGASKLYNPLNSSALDLCLRDIKAEGNNDMVCDSNPSTRVGNSSYVHEAIISSPRESLLELVLEGLVYHEPELCEEGVNGTYFLRNKAGQRIAVFKPIDEEGDNDDNPKRSFNEEQFVNKGILPGEGAQREVAAYLLDRDHFHGVPQTTMAVLSHPSFRSSTGDGGIVTKIGSLQEFIDNDGSAEDVGPKQFRVRDVHKIGVLDLRIFNTDRHAGNILLTEESDGSYRLTPIDQGLSLPSTLEHAWFDWLHWPQAKIPFDADTRCYIRHINVEEDAALLEKLSIRPECIRTMKISSTLLKKGAAAGLSLYEIASMASRTVIDQPSPLERIFEQAIIETEHQSEDSLLQTLWRLMDAEIAVKVGEQCPSPRIQESERNEIARKNAV
jgi:hypothetical protein